MLSKGPILITGASGFIGAHLVEHFVKAKESSSQRVVAVTSSAARHWRLDYLAKTSPSFETLQLDLTDKATVRAAVTKLSPTVILNLAAYGAYSSQTDEDRIYRTNLDAVRTLLEIARGLPHFQAFVQAGTSSEYGFNCTAPTEDAPTSPDSHYAVAKVAATQLVRFYALKHQLPAWTFRLYSVFGALEESSRLIPKALHACAAGKLPPLVNPTISRDFVEVSDVCRAFEKLIAAAGTLPKGEIFNIGSGKCTTLSNLVEILRKDFGVKETPQWGTMKDRAWDHPGWYSNPEKAAKSFGWRAQTDLSQGLESTLRWYRENPQWVAESHKQSVVAAPK